MESTQPGTGFYIETPLKAKIRKASQSVPQHVQWRLYIGGLVIVDVLMIGIAFRLAYYIRFQSSIEFFFQNIKPNLNFYQNLAVILIPVWLVDLPGLRIIRSSTAARGDKRVLNGLQWKRRLV